MTATTSTPRLELLDCLIDAGLEVDRLLGRLHGLDRRFMWVHRHTAAPDAGTPLGQAYRRRIDGEYEEVLGQLRVARRAAEALCLVD